MSVPNEAIDAGVKAVLAQHGIEWRLPPTEDVVWPVVWVALEAAGVVIAAAERKRILCIARKHHAVIPADEGSRAQWAAFADFIETENS